MNLKNIIKEARIFKYDILDWDSNKWEITRHVMENLDRVAYKLELITGNRGIDYSLDDAIKDINKALEDLKDITKKYDYSKLPNDL